jgi:hypothetical protein
MRFAPHRFFLVLGIAWSLTANRGDGQEKPVVSNIKDLLVKIETKRVNLRSLAQELAGLQTEDEQTIRKQIDLLVQNLAKLDFELRSADGRMLCSYPNLNLIKQGAQKNLALRTGEIRPQIEASLRQIEKIKPAPDRYDELNMDNIKRTIDVLQNEIKRKSAKPSELDKEKAGKEHDLSDKLELAKNELNSFLTTLNKTDASTNKEPKQ